MMSRNVTTGDHTHSDDPIAKARLRYIAAKERNKTAQQQSGHGATRTQHYSILLIIIILHTAQFIQIISVPNRQWRPDSPKGEREGEEEVIDAKAGELEQTPLPEVRPISKQLQQKILYYKHVHCTISEKFRLTGAEKVVARRRRSSEVQPAVVKSQQQRLTPISFFYHRLSN